MPEHNTPNHLPASRPKAAAINLAKALAKGVTTAIAAQILTACGVPMNVNQVTVNGKTIRTESSGPGVNTITSDGKQTVVMQNGKVTARIDHTTGGDHEEKVDTSIGNNSQESGTFRTAEQLRNSLSVFYDQEVMRAKQVGINPYGGVQTTYPDAESASLPKGSTVSLRFEHMDEEPALYALSYAYMDNATSKILSSTDKVYRSNGGKLTVNLKPEDIRAMQGKNISLIVFSSAMEQQGSGKESLATVLATSNKDGDVVVAKPGSEIPVQHFAIRAAVVSSLGIESDVIRVQ